MAKVAVIGPAKDWQTESDVRTLCEAEAIKKDPKRLKAAQDFAKQKLAEMGKILSE